MGGIFLHPDLLGGKQLPVQFLQALDQSVEEGFLVNCSAEFMERACDLSQLPREGRDIAVDADAQDHTALGRNLCEDAADLPAVLVQVIDPLDLGIHCAGIQYGSADSYRCHRGQMEQLCKRLPTAEKDRQVQPPFRRAEAPSQAPPSAALPLSAENRTVGSILHRFQDGIGGVYLLH
jgi:hypothetical protein